MCLPPYQARRSGSVDLSVSAGSGVPSGLPGIHEKGGRDVLDAHAVGGDRTLRQFGPTARGLVGDLVAAIVVGLFVGIVDDPWTKGVWVGSLFFAVAVAGRLVSNAWRNRRKEG